MKSAIVVGRGLVLLVVLQFSAIGYSALYEDPCAITSMSGRVDFDNLGSPALAGFVDYAVYAPGKYSGSMSFPDQFVYAYQLYCDPSSDVVIDFFSVGIRNDVAVGNVLYDDSNPYELPGGIRPSAQFALTESVLYLFQLDSVAANECSDVVLFTSDAGPAMGAGAVSGGITGGAIVELPTPVPEPATVLLVGLGSLLAVRRRRR